MKNTCRILGATFLTILYCFVLGFVGSSTIDSSINSIERSKNIDKEKYFSNYSENYSFCHTPKSANSVNTLTTLSVLTLENPLHQLWIISKVTEQLFETEYSQYSRFSINFLIQHRKKDIIFPFHYFW